eukprot:5661-Chlamydomonas_euryale.AAC.2
MPGRVRLWYGGRPASQLKLAKHVHVMGQTVRSPTVPYPTDQAMTRCAPPAVPFSALQLSDVVPLPPFPFQPCNFS